MSELRRQPVARPKVLAGAILCAAVLAGIVLLTEWLRPGAQAHPVEPPAAGGDPRDEVVCPEPEAREGQRIAPIDRARAPAQVTSNALYDCPTTWDGRRVRYRGEVVGGVLQRGEHAWLQLNDDLYAHALGPLPAHRDFRGGNAGVGVLTPVGTVPAIGVVGGPGSQGDLIEVVGTFHHVDEGSGEAAIIRAEQLRVVRPGRLVPPRADPLRVAVSVLLGSVAAALLGLQWRSRRRRFR